MKDLNELNLQTKKYIIFDMDGTLIDSIGIWNILDHNTVLKHTGKDIDLNIIQKDRNDYFHNNKTGEVYLDYCGFLAKKYGIYMSKEDLHDDRKKDAYNLLITYMDYKEYAPDVVKKLYELGYILVLATTTTRFDLDIYMNNQNLNQIPFLNLILYYHFQI